MTADIQSFEPTAERSRDLRRAFGCFGTGVTVVTTQTAQGPLGMTANSFSSISLDPALILWSPAKSSLRHDAFVCASHFCVHVLTSDQFAVAKHFASDGMDFSEVDWDIGPNGVPVLKECLAEFHCETFAVHPAGDHSVVLGQVKRVCFLNTQARGLLFDHGQFGHFSPIAPDA